MMSKIDDELRKGIMERVEQMDSRSGGLKGTRHKLYSNYVRCTGGC